MTRLCVGGGVKPLREKSRFTQQQDSPHPELETPNCQILENALIGP